MRAAVLALCLLALGHALDPDVGKDMTDICIARGYTSITQYAVTTEDGYILGLFRIPQGRAGSAGESSAGGKPVVLLQHGLLDSSYTWVCNFEKESLAFILADAGYDVWLGNSRGNFYSTAHQTLNPDSQAFWDFSWDDMAQYDLPANINFILAHTGAATLSYVGHSQGTIQAFAAFSMNHTISQKVNVFAALAPVAYVNNQKSLLLSVLADFDAVALFQLLGNEDFLPDASLLQAIAPDACAILPSGCNVVLEVLCGPSNNVNSSRLEVYMSETPAGTSVKNMAHWSQGVTTDAFQMYDYGCDILSCPNEQHYGQKTPPQYPLNAIKVPIGLFYGDDDYLADPKDVQRIIDETAAGVVVYASQVADFAHMDFTWGEDANTQVYANVMALINKYNPLK